MTHQPETHLMRWNGMLLEITTEPDHISHRLTGEKHAHLRIRSLWPSHARLPIASHQSLPTAIIDQAGGPEAFVDIMLDVEMSLQQAA